MFNPTWMFVAAVYGAAVALARRLNVDIPTRVALLFYLLVLGFLLEPMTGRTVNVHADVIRTLPPWAFMTDDHSTKNGGMNDVPLTMVPWAHAVRVSWKSFSAPLWNATTGCGMPLLANGQSAALSPLRLIALPLDLGHSMTAEAAMKLLIALTFTWLYCRRRWSETASLIAAITFGFSGFLFTWLHLPHSTTAAYLPGVFYFIDLLVERVTFGRLAGAAVLWATIVYSGQPEIAAYVFFAALLYLLWLRPRMKSLLALGGAMAVAALLAAPHLAMFAEAMTKSRRYVNLQKYPYAKSELPNSDLRSAVTHLLPNYFGPWNIAWGPVGPDSSTGFAGVLAVAGGLASAFYVIRKRAWRSKEAFFVLLALLVLGAMFDWPGFSDLFHFVIPLGAHARLRVLLVFALAVLAAAAIDFSAERRAPFLVSLAIVFVLLAAIFVLNPFPEVLRHRIPMAVINTIPAALVVMIAAVALVWRRTGALAALCVAVVADLWTGGRNFNPPTPEELLYPSTPLISKLQDLHAAAAQPFRIAGVGPMLFQNTPAIYGFEDIRVHDPMEINRYIDFLEATTKLDPIYYFDMWEDLDTHVLDFLNVRYIAADPGVNVVDRARYSLVYEGPDGRIFENTSVLPRFFAAKNVIAAFDDAEFARRLGEMDDKWAHTALLDHLELENQQMHDDFFSARPENAPPASVKIARSSATEHLVKATAPRYTLVVSSIPWWPGWKVKRNGVSIEPIRVNGAFLGFAVPAGTYDVRVWYEPSTWRYGVIVALATALALLAIGIYGSIARARRHPPASVTA